MTKAANLAAAGSSFSADANGNVTLAGTTTVTTILATTANATTVNSGLIQNGNSNVTVAANGAVSIASNGLVRATFDTSGRKTLPYQPGFFARGPDSNQTLSNGADLQFNNAIYNVGSHFNTSTYRFTAPVAGRYLFTWSVFINTVAGRCTLKVNNAGYNNLQMDVGAGLSQAAILNLNANDYVSVGDWQNISGMVCYMGHSHFSGILLA